MYVIVTVLTLIELAGFACYQPLAIIRNSWADKGPLFTEYGVTIRCVGKDQSQMVNERVC